MKQGSGRGLFGLWAALHPEAIGLLLAALLGLGLVGLVAFPIGSTRHLHGVVERTGSVLMRSTPHPTALVRLPGGALVTVRLDSWSGCRPGDSVAFQGQRRLWGVIYDAGPDPCREPPGPGLR